MWRSYHQGQGHFKVKYQVQGDFQGQIPHISNNNYLCLINVVKYLSRSKSVEGQMSRSFQGQILKLFIIANYAITSSGEVITKVKVISNVKVKVKYLNFSLY